MDNSAPTRSPESTASLVNVALKVGVMGGAGQLIPSEHLRKAEELGEAIALHGCTLITGACPGLPLAAARGAKRAGGLVVGISPGLSLDEHVYKYESPAGLHDVLVFTGSGLMGREVVNIRTSDIVIIIGGGSGTLGELAIAYDEGKLIGVLTGTGGISDQVESILAACQKETGARVIYDANPVKLIDEALRIYRTEHYRRPSCFCRACDLTEPGPDVVDSARDIVCGMWVSPSAAVAKRTIADHRYYFCSISCVQKFDENVSNYLARS